MENGHLSKVSQRILRKRVPILLCSKPPKPSSGPPCLVMNDVLNIETVLCSSSPQSHTQPIDQPILILFFTPLTPPTWNTT